MQKIIFTISILVLVSHALIAQEVLSLDEVREITLANNFGIQVAKNNVEIAANNTEKRANRYLPDVSANAGMNGSLGGSKQSFNAGFEATTSNAFTWGGNASVNANYTLYDKSRSLTLEQLNRSVDLANLQLRQSIEVNLLQVYAGYYQLARLSENIAVLDEAIAVSGERLRRAEISLDYGQGSGLEVLNAQVDIQRDSINLLNARQQLANARRNLNVLMGTDADRTFEVDTALRYVSEVEISALLEKAQAENVALQIGRQNLSVSEMNLQLIDAEQMPVITSGASYTFNYTDNPDEAFITNSNNRNLGANIGVSWTIFDGSRKIRRQNSQLNLTNLSIQQNQLEQELNRDLYNAFESYKNALFILQVEESAVATNRENFERTKEQFEGGRLTSIEFRQAQLNLLNARFSLNGAKYDAKLRELELLQLAGGLLE